MQHEGVIDGFGKKSNTDIGTCLLFNTDTVMTLLFCVLFYFCFFFFFLSLTFDSFHYEYCIVMSEKESYRSLKYAKQIENH